MDSVGTKLDLLEKGTRYDHYTELKEVFMLGIAVIDGMQRPSPSDKKTKVKLEAAVDLIEMRLRYLADYDRQIFKVNREIRMAGVHKTPLLSEENHDTKNDVPQTVSELDSEENQGSPSEESGRIKGGWPEAPTSGSGSVS